MYVRVRRVLVYTRYNLYWRWLRNSQQSKVYRVDVNPTLICCDWRTRSCSLTWPPDNMSFEFNGKSLHLFTVAETKYVDCKWNLCGIWDSITGEGLFSIEWICSDSTCKILHPNWFFLFRCSLSFPLLFVRFSLSSVEHKTCILNILYYLRTEFTILNIRNKWRIDKHEKYT